MDRREFLNVLAIAAAAGLPISSREALAAADGTKLYDVPRFGNVSLLHMTDCHAQLMPIHFREPSVNLGIAGASGKAPHLVGEHLLKASRPGALLLDGGDTWQGSATALWTKGQDMVDASKALGVDIMTAHWEFTLGAERVKEILEKDFKGHIDFVAQNVSTTDFNDPVFTPYVIRQINGVAVAIVGQAFPYTPIANPRYLVPDWTFGIKEPELQKAIDQARAKGAQVVVLLSHNGMDVDLKLAGRVTGIDAILGGHTHDGVPQPVEVRNAKGVTLVTNAGSNSKFLGVLDLDVKEGRIAGWKYRLLPVFANLLAPDPAMAALIAKVRAPYESKLAEKLAVTEGLLYRRGSFNGTVDQVILDALMQVKGAQIAFSPGFRWGTTLLPGQAVTVEHVMDWSAISYPQTTLNELTGEMIKAILEDVGDNLFNPDPYYQQGGDMVRVGGLTYTCTPGAEMGRRISDMRLGGKPIEAGRTYKVAGWAPVAEGATGEPIWEVITTYLKDRKSLAPVKLNVPKIVGMEGNAGMA